MWGGQSCPQPPFKAALGCSAGWKAGGRHDCLPPKTSTRISDATRHPPPTTRLLTYLCQKTTPRRKMSKEDSIEVTGTVVEKFPSGLFSVQLDQDRTVLAHLAGKLRRNRIRVLAGDRVTLELSPYDLTKGRITYRHK